MVWLRYFAAVGFILGVVILALAVMSRQSQEAVETPDFIAVAETPRALPSRTAAPSVLSTLFLLTHRPRPGERRTRTR